MKVKIFEISAFAALVFAIIISLVSFESGCEQVRKNVLRLHVIANSDTYEDQQLKLKVRDAVLEAGETVFGSGADAADAARLIEKNGQALTLAARRVLKENGCDSDVAVSVCEDSFPTKTYGRYTLPAGRYTAVKVTIGEGRGRNWWCVMFPPLCLPAAENKVELDDVLGAQGIDVVTSKTRYEVRFKIVEWVEKLRERRQ